MKSAESGKFVLGALRQEAGSGIIEAGGGSSAHRIRQPLATTQSEFSADGADNC